MLKINFVARSGAVHHLTAGTLTAVASAPRAH
jgi:hypothetical protein